MHTYIISNLKKKTNTLLILILTLILQSCMIELYKTNELTHKEEIVSLIEANINKLTILTNEIYLKFKNKNHIISIENKLLKKWNDSFEYRTSLSNEIFNAINIQYIYIDYDEQKVEYILIDNYGSHIGFYYSFNDNKNYYCFEDNHMKQLTEEGFYLEFGDKTALFDSRHGWYTEKICDNWYFFEQDFDNLNFLKYVYDDIVNMDPPNKFYQENKQFFEKYNPHNEGSKNKVSN